MPWCGFHPFPKGSGLGWRHVGVAVSGLGTVRVGGREVVHLRNTTALITGAAQGVGRDIAILFAAKGASVALVDTDRHGLTTVVQTIRSAGGSAVSTVGDVSEARVCQEAVAATESQFGRLQVLVNNAGIMHPEDSDAEHLTSTAWQETLKNNLTSIWLACRAAIPAMRRAGGGSIVNMSSLAALRGSYPSQLAYTASKGGVLAMSRELAVTYATEGIRVNSICAGPLHTQLMRHQLANEHDVSLRTDQIPIGRLGEPDEVASVALWLASTASSYVTGAAVEVDGGASAAFLPRRP